MWDWIAAHPVATVMLVIVAAILVMLALAWIAEPLEVTLPEQDVEQLDVPPCELRQCNFGDPLQPQAPTTEPPFSEPTP